MKLFNFIVNLVFKLVKVLPNSLSLINSVSSILKKDKAIDCKQKTYESPLNFGGCRCFLMDFENNRIINYGVN